MRFFFVYVTLSLIISQNACCQDKQTENREMMWAGYFNQSRFTTRSGLWADVHLRLTDEFVNEVHAALGRIAYVYFFSDRARLSAGYAWQHQPGHQGSRDVNERRAWQQIQWFEKKNWFNMMQWLRVEQRFHEKQEQYEFSNYRVRYNMALTIPVTRREVLPRTPFVFVNNELFVNFGKNIVNNYFDQNRFFIGLGYQVDTHLNFQLGYMNVFQQLPAGNRYVNTDAIRLFVFHGLDLRRK